MKKLLIAGSIIGLTCYAQQQQPTLNIMTDTNMPSVTLVVTPLEQKYIEALRIRKAQLQAQQAINRVTDTNVLAILRVQALKNAASTNR